jgi:hypothetical protein
MTINFKRILPFASLLLIAAGSNLRADLLPLFDLSGLVSGEQTGTFHEDGYTVVLATLNGLGVFANPGIDLEPRCCASGGEVIITHTGGGTFTFNSIGLLEGYGAVPAFLDVQGFLGGVSKGTDVFFGSTPGLVTQLAGAPLAGITLDELVITGQRDATAGVGFGNLTVTPGAAVPEPDSIILLVSAIGAAGLVVRKKRLQGRV